MGLEKNIVKLEKYNPIWESMFLEEKRNLEELFGDTAIIIEHIGSTSIKGLSSKPIIDILVGILDLEDFNDIRYKFENYEIKKDPTPGEELIVKTSNNETTHLIHVMEVDSKRCKDVILFRNYLRCHEDALKEYEKLKIILALRYKNDRHKYTASKNEFINDILLKAYEEI